MTATQGSAAKADKAGGKTAKMGKREANALAIRRNILAAARQLISEEGYEAATITRLRKQAGVSIATFYNYFESKQSVLLGLLEDEQQRSVAAVEQATQGDISDAVAFMLEIILVALHPPGETVDKAMWREILAASLLLKTDKERVEGLQSERSFYSQQMIVAMQRLIDSGSLQAECPLEKISDIIYCISAHEFQEYVSGGFDDRETLHQHLHSMLSTLIGPWLI
ncbi:TetR/AcrR family transcriptional regulator [Oceanobacter mangrovi]|uniref:TetR/AcrR family transcriptional regulator n=1 Tax=Oceanobacter mangrovi TaxID=2862510 RepID=UPI001C8D7496|nr:TetR/AcrR family transcriptional regulator [Oceanobacter mangrovi]